MKFKLIIATAILAGILLAGCEKEKYIYEPGNLVPKTVDQDPSLPAITVNGVQLHAEAFGHPDSAIIVVLHGGPGSDYRYLLNCKAFADAGYRVVFYDQRGSGLSQRLGKSTYSIQVVLDELQGVIAHYKQFPTQKIFLLGHSWGAMLATAYINAYPAEISGAVLAEPGGFVWQDILDYVGRSRSVVVTSELFSDFLYQDQFITGKEDEQEILDYKFGLLSIADGGKGSPIGNEGPLPFWRSGAIINQALFEIGNVEKPDWTTNLDQFTTKVLFVYSENNQAYGPDHAQKVSSAYPNVQLLKIDDSGHDMLSFPTGWSHFYPEALNYFISLK